MHTGGIYLGDLSDGDCGLFGGDLCERADYMGRKGKPVFRLFVGRLQVFFPEFYFRIGMILYRHICAFQVFPTVVEYDQIVCILGNLYADLPMLSGALIKYGIFPVGKNDTEYTGHFLTERQEQVYMDTDV